MSFDFSDTAREALEADGPMLVLGGPGSGKTTLSLFKAQRLIPDLAPGQEVLFLSFSRAAVHQVVVRCKDMLSADERRRIAVKTYHAFCMEVLQAHGRLLTGRQPRILFPRDERLRKSSHEGDWPTEQERLADEEGLYAFDQFARSSAHLLTRANCVRALLADHYPIIILDEFQDTNDAQWTLVQQLALASRMVVLADPDQRIFEYDTSVDPRRLDQLRETIALAEFDLGTENHRSPGGGILTFADAVLRNRPLPAVAEVVCQRFWGNSIEGTVHAAVQSLLAELETGGVAHPSVAILCRTNLLVLRLSEALSKECTFNGRTYSPVEHVVSWDPELSAAAAAVVASILEWTRGTADSMAASTLSSLADFYDIKNSLKSSKEARRVATTLRSAAEYAQASRTPRSKAGKAIVAASKTGIALTGNPVEDWKRAQLMLDGASHLSEVQRYSRLVRLFRASGEIGPQLSEQWSKSGTYGQARSIVRRAIDHATLVSARSDPRGLVLMTIHKSKGREFDGTILVEGPHSSPFLNTEREQAPYHESRRLLRVGITRARSRVLLLRPTTAPPLVGIHA